MKKLNKNLKTILIAVGLIASIMGAYTLGFYSGQTFGVYQEVKHPHMVNVVIWRSGVVIYNYTTHNILTTIGATHVRDILGFDNRTQRQIIYVSLSSDTSPDKSWTKLPNEITDGGLARTAGTPTVINATAFQVVASWTATGSYTISCTGIHWDGTAGSDGNLFAAAEIPTANVISGDNIQVTWTINTPDG